MIGIAAIARMTGSASFIYEYNDKPGPGWQWETLAHWDRGFGPT
jgi:hypothetical protein